MHVSDDSSNKFCKSDEIWRTLKRCGKFVVFLGLTDGIFMKKKLILQMGSNFTCMFQIMISINFVSLMILGKL